MALETSFPASKAAPTRTGQGSAWSIALARFLVCFAIAPNLPFWLLARREGIALPGMLSLDSLALGLAALWVRPGWLIVLFCGDFLLDVIACIHATFGTGYIEILLSVRYLFTAVAANELASIAILILLSMALVAAVWIGLPPRIDGRGRWALVMVVLAALLPWGAASKSARTADTAAQQATYAHERAGVSRMSAQAAPAAPWQHLLAMSFRSPGLAFVHAWERQHLWTWMWHHSPLVLQPVSSAVDVVKPWLPAGPRHPHFVLVLLESWGHGNGTALNQLLLAPFRTPALQTRYELRHGLVTYAGTTADGELRELCDRKRPLDAPLALLAPAAIARCLPWQMRSQGYRTVAIDSVATYWPGGADWYRLLGFQQVLAFPQLHRLGLPTTTAGPFRSIDDAAIAGMIPRLLEAKPPQPTFAFLLTTGAHLPIHLPLPAGSGTDCSQAPATRDFPAVCGWYDLERRALEGVARAAAEPGLPPTVFLIVGDHAPPFLGPARAPFSTTQVPYELLTPRALAPAP